MPVTMIPSSKTPVGLGKVMSRMSAGRIHEMNEVFRGELAGLAGTGVMSVAMASAKAAGLLAGEPPPRTVSRNLEETIGVYDHLPQPAFEASWVVAVHRCSCAGYARTATAANEGGLLLRGGIPQLDPLRAA